MSDIKSFNIFSIHKQLCLIFLQIKIPHLVKVEEVLKSSGAWDKNHFTLKFKHLALTVWFVKC